MNTCIRDVQKEDGPFILATWLRSQYFGNTWFKQIDKDTFFREHQLILKRILMLAKVRVLCLVDDPDVVLGYIVYNKPTLHWVYVKKAWRKLGIAKQLLEECPDIQQVSHITKIGKALKPETWAFNPYAL